MESGREAIRFLSACQQVWHSRFPELQQRAQWHIVMHLCTLGRSGTANGEIEGLVRQSLLLDDATVRERIGRLQSLGLCDIDPPDRPLSARSLVTPTPALLERFDAHVLAMGAHLASAAEAVAPGGGFMAPATLEGGRGAAVLAGVEGTRRAWFEAADQVFLVRGLSRARVIEARRHLQAGPQWLLMQYALEHAAGLLRLPADQSGIQADHLAAALIQVNGQNFQTTRDHIAELIELGLLERRPGRALHVALAADAAGPFAAAMARAQTMLPEWAQPLRAGPGHAGDDPEEAVATVNRRAPATASAGRHDLLVTGPGMQRRRVTIDTPTLVLGRAPGPGASLTLASNDVSRQHCRIDITPDGATVTDLGSTNGTLLNGRPIARPVLLRQGARLGIGPFLLEYEQGSVAADPDATMRRAVRHGNKAGQSA
jgi:pSer/pThr/pTyr-binding forkhead associated (FHA) protein